MPPDRHVRRADRKPGPSLKDVRFRPSSDDAHEIAFFKRHLDDDPGQAVPGREFLRSCPPAVAVKFFAVLTQVALAPPKRFRGGGYWEAMHGSMTGWFEVRCDGPGRTHHRLFCLLDYEAAELTKPLLVVVDGRSKPIRTVLAEADYVAVRALGTEYRRRNPRSLA